MVPKYDWLRAEVAPMDGPPADATDETNEVIQSDDDNDGGPDAPGNQATSSQNNQISTSDDPISEGEGFRNEPSISGEDPQPGPGCQRNQGSSPSLTEETAEHPNVDISDETDRSANQNPQPHGVSGPARSNEESLRQPLSPNMWH